MSVTVIHHCNRCGAAKGATNHWFAIRPTYTVAEGQNESVTRKLLTFQVFAFADCAETDEHYCGEACLIAAVSEKTKELA